ncbi:hypothetical protein KIPB_000333 [Kipferlia bialata]|uniref:Uncharacterized protein n=1 Tax=Kipferlia bialata TaxID=797122 RepID=A0A9K3GEF0_9EUKA|nr:hypothetical protein KIPB_000333 [Kipferlia bialata]|eukprot:g333.t1
MPVVPAPPLTLLAGCALFLLLVCTGSVWADPLLFCATDSTTPTYAAVVHEWGEDIATLVDTESFVVLDPSVGPSTTVTHKLALTRFSSSQTVLAYLHCGEDWEVY